MARLLSSVHSADETENLFARLDPGKMMVTFDRGDSWQCADVIAPLITNDAEPIFYMVDGARSGFRDWNTALATQPAAGSANPPASAPAPASSTRPTAGSPAKP